MSTPISFSAEEGQSTSALEITPAELEQMEWTEEFRLWLATQQNEDATTDDRATHADSRIDSTARTSPQVVEVSSSPSREISIQRRSLHDSSTGLILDRDVVETTYNEGNQTSWEADHTVIETLIGEEPAWMSLFENWN